MAKLCGAISLCGENAESICRRLCQSMMEPYARSLHEKTYASRILSFGEASFALVAIGQESTALSSLAVVRDSRLAVLAGYVLGIDSSETKTSEDVLGGIDILGESCASHKLEALAELDGVYSFAVWDSAAKCLSLANDKLGLSPLYVASNTDWILFASEAESLAGTGLLNLEVDLGAIAEFFALGHVLGGKTFYSCIKNLAPATLRTYAKGTASDSSYYVFTPSYNSNLSEDVYTEKTLDSFVAAVDARVTSQPTCLRLSGGLDSRFILGCLLRLGHDVMAETFFIKSVDDEADAAYARALAQQNAFEIRFQQKVCKSSLRQRVWGVTKSQHSAFNGIWGGELLGAMGLLLSGRNLDNPDAILSDVMSPDLVRALPQSPSQAIQRSMTSAPMGNDEARKLYYYFINNTRSFLSSGQGIGWERPNYFFVGEGLYPFVDTSFLQAVFSIPCHLTHGRRFYISLLQKEFPSLMRVPWISKPGDAITCGADECAYLSNYKAMERPQHTSEYMSCAQQILTVQSPHLRRLFKNPGQLARPRTARDHIILRRFVLFGLWNEMHGPLFS